MTDERLKRLANQILGFFRKTEDIRDMYVILREVSKKQKEYFLNLTPSEFLKLLIYIFSYRTTGYADLGVNILDKLFFASLFTKSGIQWTETCDDCGGSGNETCDDCGGDGYVDCVKCDGDGSFLCDNCDGDGYEDEETKCNACDGRGDIDCEKCNGSQQETCMNCGGDGSVSCDSCNGRGDYEGDDVGFNLWFICSWDQDLKNRCEMYENTINSIGNENFVLDNPKVILLKEVEWGDLSWEFDSDVESDLLYCYKFSDDENLITNQMSFEISSLEFLRPNKDKFAEFGS